MKVLKQYLFGLFCLALVTGFSWAQEKPKAKQGSILTSPEENEAAKKRHQLLKHPNFVTLELVPMPRDNLTDATPFKVGDRVMFKLIMIHSLTEPLEIFRTDVYDQDRPELVRDNDPEAYTKDVAAIVKIKDERLEVFRENPIRIEPGKPSQIAIIDLGDWYKRLRVGHYQLTVRHRFVWGGDWVRSNSVTFEVQ